MKATPTRDQLAALVAFAKEQGRCWKSQLNQEWMNGCCYNSDLIRVRNTFGPTWLVRFNLKDAIRSLNTPKCDQCRMSAINGLNCHERGCPNERKTWMPDTGEWKLFLKCWECGSEVEAGESCCQGQAEPEEEEDEDDEEDPDDPDGQNEDRAEWAQRAIDAFQAATRTDDEDALVDLLADLAHWCDRHDCTLDAALETAKMHYAEEAPNGHQFDFIEPEVTEAKGTDTHEAL